MRKEYWIALVVVVSAGVGGGYWYMTTKRIEPPQFPVAKLPPAKTPDNDGHAEQSEVIEPIVVDAPTKSTQDPVKAQVMHVDMMSPVVSSPGTSQPPRPEARTGRAPRMPYADEKEIDGLDRDPISRILDPNLRPANLFEGLRGVFDEPAPKSERP